ncbi:glycosyl hydrolase 115 family protein [Aegicerativicinus sediminis]|uniref:glycosyl hydrolase 115 family protein n=1 Tax=Aegicerativicinus sediminis TaxID=2893202 RepID=UPI001E382CA1|nr:glycosyl hydrolase 115 family protein [Aegicerativicinus sediminis]
MGNYFKILFTDSYIFVLLAFSCNTSETATSNPTDFEIVTEQTQTAIVYQFGKGLDSISSHLLAKDIYAISGYKPTVSNSLEGLEGNVIIIGTIGSELLNPLLNQNDFPNTFTNQWESYLYKTINAPTEKISKAFVIGGTDARGTAFGVFSLSEKLGVSPWYWWADVPIRKSENLILAQKDFFSDEPTVKYRGIFLNDEDWGLQPWAADTFEPEIGDIGPKTYSKIFELLLRLKANTIWPAMHPSTKAFFHYPGNAKMASLYNIVIGTSHAEPMLRNNVDEWEEETMGHFDYKNNRDAVHTYWETRVKESKNIDAIYSMGMRGVHDSGMEGVNSKEEAVSLLDDIISDQRNMLETNINESVSEIPQAFTIYKEVLDLYKNGLVIPEDITLVWTDDNYGYIRALSNSEEQKRKGGSGVYYHASYWGRPHDYLWLSSTNPALMREEMIKAYTLNNKQIWILNVGDIKPLEYNTQLFLDMAYNAKAFFKSKSIKTHQQKFYTEIFGEEFGNKIEEIKTKYYQLAFERRPEFMGWSQTEPTTPINNTSYVPFINGDEIQLRLESYQNLENELEQIEPQIPNERKSSFYQLVGYPVKAASSMNQKFLYRDKALAYANQGRLSSLKYKKLAHDSYKKIVELTETYNELSNGKWRGIMYMKPRELPVFDDPIIDLKIKETEEIMGISPETEFSDMNAAMRLPKFYLNDTQSHFLDLYLTTEKIASWQITNKPSWIVVDEVSGELNPSGISEKRLFFSIDWKDWINSGSTEKGKFTIATEQFEKDIQINLSDSYKTAPLNSIVEKNGMAVIYAEHFSKILPSETFQWNTITGLGHTSNVIQSEPLSQNFSITDFKNSAIAEYEIYTENLNENAVLSIVALPNHAVTTDGELRIGVQFNDGPIEVVNFKTEGRSETWKINVLSNKAIQYIKAPISEVGKQTIKIYSLDPAVIIDYIVLNNSGTITLPYKLMPETRINLKANEDD